jgi:aryl-alcohol dehydrogenase-like predicted oxidoreductase
MKRAFLCPSGLAVSELALGTQIWGWSADERTAGAMADRFVEASGFPLVDTD